MQEKKLVREVEYEVQPPRYASPFSPVGWYIVGALVFVGAVTVAAVACAAIVRLLEAWR